MFYLKKPKDAWLYLFFVAIFFLLSFLRWQRGTDWDSYLTNFILSKYSVVDNFEFGYKYIIYFCHQITDSYTFALFCCALIIFSLKYYACYKYSELSLVSLLACFAIYYADIFFVRQNIAMSIDFFSLIFILRKQPAKFVGCVLLSCLFHKTSIIFLLAYKAFYIKVNRRIVICSVFILLLFYFFNYMIMKYAFLYFSAIGSKFVLYFNDSLNKDVIIGNESVTFYVVKGIINRLFLLFLVYLLRKRIVFDQISLGIINLYILGGIVFTSLTFISLPLGRFAQYFFQFEILIIAIICNNHFRFANKVLIYTIVCLFLFTRLIYNTYGDMGELFVPFKFVWEDTPVRVF